MKLYAPQLSAPVIGSIQPRAHIPPAPASRETPTTPPRLRRFLLPTRFCNAAPTLPPTPSRTAPSTLTKPRDHPAISRCGVCELFGELGTNGREERRKKEIEREREGEREAARFFFDFFSVSLRASDRYHVLGSLSYSLASCGTSKARGSALFRGFGHSWKGRSRELRWK